MLVAYRLPSQQHLVPPQQRLVLGVVLHATLLALPTLAVADQADLEADATIPRAADAPLPLSPEASRDCFSLPAELEIELVAGEPLLRDPAAVLRDPRGQLFACELHGYNLEGHLDVVELNKTGKLDREIRRVRLTGEVYERAKRQRSGVVKRLIDSDGDGRMDEAAVWADDLPPCYGMVAYRDGLIVVCGPDIVFLADRDMDGVAEIRELLFTGFEVDVMERAINNPRWGVDGWIYVAAGGEPAEVTGPNLPAPASLGRTDFRFRPDGSAIEPVTGVNGTFGHTLNALDQRFLITTSIHALYAIPLPYRYLARNPYVPAPSENANATDYNQVFPTSEPHPWRQARGEDPRWVKFYGAREATPNGYFTSACGPLIYRSDLLPETYRGNLFCCEPSQNLVHRCLIEREDAGYRVRRAVGDEASEFLASTDRWHRPMNLYVDADGAIIVVDLYREIIEDYSAIPRHLQQQYGLIEGHDHGRLWRIAPRGAGAVETDDLTQLSPTEWVACLDSTNSWRRETAQRLLVELAAPEKFAAVVTPLKELAANAELPETRIRALYALASRDQLHAAVVRQALDDQCYGVRVHALRLAEPRLGLDDALRRRVVASVDDPDPSVRLQAAMTLGESDDPAVVDALARLAVNHPKQRWLDAAILSSAADICGPLISEILAIVENDEAVAPVLEQLAACVGARRDAAEIGSLLATVAAVSDDRATVALLEGFAAGLQRGASSELRVSGFDDAFRRLIANRSGKVRLRALRVARLLNLDQSPAMAELWQAAERSALDRTAPSEERTAATEMLANAPWEYRRRLATLLNLREPDDLQKLAVEALAVDEATTGIELLLSRASELSPPIQEAVVDACFVRLDRRGLLLDAIEQGQIPAAQISSLRRTQLLESSDGDVQSRAARLFDGASNEARDAVLQQYQAALELKGRPDRGEKVFAKQCAQCHRLNGAGHQVGPDLAGVARRPPATLLIDILDPSRSVDPEYAVYTVATHAGKTYAGILTAESATSITLRREKGEQDVILRRDIGEAVAAASSLMPEGMERLVSPADLADLFAYLKQQTTADPTATKVLFDEQDDFAALLKEGSGTVETTRTDPFSGSLALRITPLQRHASQIADWNFPIRETPGPGEYRYLRFAWRGESAAGMMLEVAAERRWPAADRPARRYYCGDNQTDWQATQIALSTPTEWTVVTIDLWKDAGDFELTGLAPTTMGGAAWFDAIELHRTLPR